MLTPLAACAIAAVHLASPLLRGLDGRPRSIWLSTAGGVSVAYVFVHVLPELEEGQRTLEETTSAWLGFLEHHAYLIALIGLSVYYGLDRLALRSRARAREQDASDQAAPAVFWLHITSFSIYNALVGYLLVQRPRDDYTGLVLFVIAMTLHFVVTDRSLQEHHKRAYASRGRFLLAGAVLAGAAVGGWLRLSEPTTAALFAFLAGGIVLNVLKEELPEEREGRYLAFLAGAGGYAALLLSLA